MLVEDKAEKPHDLKLKKIKENEEKFSQNNEQINKLVISFNDYLKQVNKGFKVNNFFHEFDEKVGMDFKALVYINL